MAAAGLEATTAPAIAVLTIICMSDLRDGRAPTTGARCGGSASNRPVSDGAIAAFGQSGDVFVGGVLYTQSAWVIWTASFVARVRAEGKAEPFPSACFCVITRS